MGERVKVKGGGGWVVENHGWTPLLLLPPSLSMYFALRNGWDGTLFWIRLAPAESPGAAAAVSGCRGRCCRVPRLTVRPGDTSAHGRMGWKWHYHGLPAIDSVPACLGASHGLHATYRLCLCTRPPEFPPPSTLMSTYLLPTSLEPRRSAVRVQWLGAAPTPRLDCLSITPGL